MAAAISSAPPQYGGASNDGTVFEVAAGSGAITTLASFNGTNGLEPFAGLVEDSSGNLFGTATDGGATVTARCSRWSRAAAPSPPWPPSTAPTGNGPQAGLIADGSGNLFGTTCGGRRVSATARCSRWPRAAHAITTLASFNGTNGADPAVQAWSRTAAAISSAPPRRRRVQ